MCGVSPNGFVPSGTPSALGNNGANTSSYCGGSGSNLSTTSSGVFNGISGSSPITGTLISVIMILVVVVLSLAGIALMRYLSKTSIAQNNDDIKEIK
jgi:hypothetical protein